MKKYLVIASAILFAACNDSATETTTSEDSSTNMSSSTTSVPNTDMDATVVTTSEQSAFESRSFVNLETGKSITLRRDTVSYKYVDATTNSDAGYYYDPATNDTFDSRGYIVNNSLTLSNGNYKIDEVKVSANPDNIKIKDEMSKYKMDHNSSKLKEGDDKIKQRGDTYKEKTDSTKLKVDDGKMKIKKK